MARPTPCAHTATTVSCRCCCCCCCCSSCCCCCCPAGQACNAPPSRPPMLLPSAAAHPLTHCCSRQPPWCCTQAPHLRATARLGRRACRAPRAPTPRARTAWPPMASCPAQSVRQGGPWWVGWAGWGGAVVRCRFGQQVESTVRWVAGEGVDGAGLQARLASPQPCHSRSAACSEQDTHFCSRARSFPSHTTPTHMYSRIHTHTPVHRCTRACTHTHAQHT